MEVLARITRALLEDLYDPEALVRHAVESQIRFELTDHPVAATLHQALGYHGTVVVPNLREIVPSKAIP
jgi:hypothetical protein